LVVKEDKDDDNDYGGDGEDAKADNEDEHVAGEIDNAYGFMKGDASAMFAELKEMIEKEKTISQIAVHGLRVIYLMQLGKIQKGSIAMDLKFKSLPARWFGSKDKKMVKDDLAEDCAVYIRRDSLITFSVKRGKTTTCERYRVLGIFSDTTTNGMYIGRTKSCIRKTQKIIRYWQG
jgi:hypothetical protein